MTDEVIHDQQKVVLVVEDDILQRMDVAAILATAGYAVLEASDADSAAQVLRNLHPKVDAIVTDVQMPGEYDGRDLAWRVYRCWPHVRIIVVSGAPNLDLEPFPPGAQVFSKPVATHKLLGAVAL